MELGAIISQKRKQAGLTIDELAERSGVPKGTLNKIINGYTRDPQIETVKSIARALDCTLEDFDDSPRVRTLSTDEYDLIQQISIDKGIRAPAKSWRDSNTMSNRITRRRGMSRICWEITPCVIHGVQTLFFGRTS